MAQDTAPSRTTETDDQQAGSLGLVAATAIVMGSIVGTGAFTLPISLAPYGAWLAILSFIVATIGALALAHVFGRLARRLPFGGGPYIYARDAFGEQVGFLNAWAYWITAWAGNAAIVVGWVGYVDYLFDKNSNFSNFVAVLVGLVGLWIPAAINLTGAKNMGAVQTATVILKFIPLALIGLLGLFFIKGENFGAFIPSDLHLNFVQAISATLALTLFSFLGLETASVAARNVRNPSINIPKATLYGVAACALVYILCTTAVFGILGADKIGKSTAPFADAGTVMFGDWFGTVVAVGAVISGIGALNGWTAIVAETSLAAAKDRVFPDFFARTPRGIPIAGIITGSILASALMIFNYSGSGLAEAFTKLVTLSTLTSVVPYAFSAAAQWYWLVTKGREVQWPTLARDTGIAVLAFAFSVWAVATTGYQTVYYGFIGILVGIPVYIYMKAKRRQYGEDVTGTYVTGVSVADGLYHD